MRVKGSTARRRPKRDQDREGLLEAGVDLLYERGLADGAGHITLSEAAARFEASTGRRLTAGSVYGRLWDTQADYQLDVLARAGARFSRDAAELLERPLEIVSAETPTAGALRQMALTVARDLARDLTQLRSWQVWVAMGAIAASTPRAEDDIVIQPVVAAGYDLLTDRLTSRYQDLPARFGYRPRSGFELRDFATAAIALVEGLALRSRSGGMPGEQPGLEDIAAHALEGLAAAFFEPAAAPSSAGD